MAKSGCLVLEDGKMFDGTLFGATPPSDFTKSDRCYGEVVFNTSMTGYQEILTDPSYFGQMICMTVPHVGNTGVNDEDLESAKVWCGGFVVHQNSDHPSNWRSLGSLHSYLEKSGIPGLSGVDTRALTLHLRSKGVVRGVILSQSDKPRALDLLKALPQFEGRDMIAEVTTSKPFVWKSEGPPQFRVAALDFGVKWNLLRSLAKQGCEIDVLPASTAAEEILAKKYDGVFLSNGPGDPTAAPYAVKAVKKLLGNIPIFGVCMGHQILALAIGARTYKLKFGHHGGNQPVLDRRTGRVEISSHNHGYAVDGSSLPSGTEITHVNLNDRTVEGLCIKGARAFSVQYHPEACPGPHDSVVLFKQFIDVIRS